MTANITAVRPLAPLTQLEQLVTTVGSLLASLCERTDEAFQRTAVIKRDDQGNIRFFNKKDPETGQTTQVSVINFIEDIQSGDLYLDEGMPTVCLKCALLVLGLPFYTIGKMAWHVVKTPLDITAIALGTLYVMVGCFLATADMQEVFKFAMYGVIEALDTAGYGLFEIVKAPLFGLGAELASLYGILKPYHGRKFESLIENAWECGASYRDDFRKIPAREEESTCEAFVKDLQSGRPFYLAHCFPARGNTFDPRITVIHRESI